MLPYASSEVAIELDRFIAGAGSKVHEIYVAAPGAEVGLRYRDGWFVLEVVISVMSDACGHRPLGHETGAECPYADLVLHSIPRGAGEIDHSRVVTGRRRVGCQHRVAGIRKSGLVIL